jgi:NADH dehydrogenase
VKVLLNTGIKRLENGRAYYSDTEYIPTENMIWAAGVNGTALPGIPEAAVTRNKRVTVNRWNQVEGETNIFAIGDLANMVTEESPKGLPMLAPVAQQQADLLAKNIQRLLKGEKPEEFNYFDKGVMAIVSRNRAVVDMPNGWHFKGILGWLSWLFIHLILLVGFRNRIVALITWAFSYFSSGQALRLIIRPFNKRDVKDSPGKKAAEHAAATLEYNATPSAVHGR